MNKDKKRIIILIVLVCLMFVIFLLLRTPKAEDKSLRERHEEMLKESQETLRERNETSEDTLSNNSNLEISKIETSGSKPSEYLESAINDIKDKKTFNFDGYTMIEDTTDYSRYKDMTDLIKKGETGVKPTQKYYFKESAFSAYNRMRFVFSWVDINQQLTEYHLYNEDKSLEYLPVEINAGNIVYIIDNVSEGDKFYFYLDAPFLGGVSFTQEEQSVSDAMNFNTEEDILAYYGDWIYELEE